MSDSDEDATFSEEEEASPGAEEATLQEELGEKDQVHLWM